MDRNVSWIELLMGRGFRHRRERSRKSGGRGQHPCIHPAGVAEIAETIFYARPLAPGGVGAVISAMSLPGVPSGVYGCGRPLYRRCNNVD